MKKKNLSLLFCLLVFLANDALSVVPSVVNFQGRLTDASGNPITTARDIRFRLCTGATGDNCSLWSEVKSNITPDSNGIYNVVLGESSSLASINMAQTLYLELEVRSPGAASGETLTPRMLLATAPSARTAAKLENIVHVSGSYAGIDVASPVNKLDVEGNMAIGSGYSGTNTAPTNGLLVEGNVGIGTTSPAKKLHVSGASSLDGSVSIGASYAGSDTAPSNGLIVQGNIGIATNNPVTRLHIVGTDDTELTTHGLLVLGATTTANISIDQNEIMARDNGAIATLYLNNDGGNVVFGGSTAGNVGIGTTGPTQKLDVAGHINMSGATSRTIFYGNVGVAAPGAGSVGEKIQFYGTAGTVGASDYALGIESSNMWFNTNSGYKWYQDSNAKMVMDVNGNFGIGTTSPGALLDVKSQLFVRDGSYVEVKPGGSTYGFIIRDYDSSNWGNLDANDGYLAVGYNNNDGPLYVTGSRVGIGTSSPGHKLEVNNGHIAINNPANNEVVIWYQQAGINKMSTYLNSTGTHWRVARYDANGNFAATALSVAYSNGDVAIEGALSKGSGSFLIDHPLDPKNKILRHSFIESPDMKNIYDGLAELDGQGEATIKFPQYFDKLNRDYRYLLTAIGQPAPNLYIKKEIEDNSFVIAGGNPHQKISWQVTGIRNDVFAQINPIIVEEEKGKGNDYVKGKLIHKDAYKEFEKREKDKKKMVRK